MDCIQTLNCLKNCKHTFCYDSQIVCSNCHVNEQKYTEFKNMIDNIDDDERKDIISVFEMEYPFVNNQEHQEEDKKSISKGFVKNSTTVSFQEIFSFGENILNKWKTFFFFIEDGVLWNVFARL